MALLSQLESAPSPDLALSATVVAEVKAGPAVSSPVRAGIYKEAFFCGISPLRSHLNDETKEKIWGNKYVDIWSFILVDQHTVDRERQVFSDKPVDKKIIFGSRLFPCWAASWNSGIQNGAPNSLFTKIRCTMSLSPMVAAPGGSTMRTVAATRHRLGG